MSIGTPPGAGASPVRDYRYDPERSGTNVLSIAAFVTSFFGVVVGIVLGFVALAQIRRTGERGHGLAVAAIAIGIASAVLLVGTVLTLVVVFAVVADAHAGAL